MTERTNPLDYPFIGCGTALVVVILLPLMWLAALRFVPQPPADDGAAYRDGAYAACVTFGVGAGAPRSDYEPFCADMADDLAAARP